MKKILIIFLGVLICETAFAMDFDANFTLPNFKPPTQKKLEKYRQREIADREKSIFFSKQLVRDQNEKRYKQATDNNARYRSEHPELFIKRSE